MNNLKSLANNCKFEYIHKLQRRKQNLRKKTNDKHLTLKLKNIYEKH